LFSKDFEHLLSGVVKGRPARTNSRDCKHKSAVRLTIPNLIYEHQRILAMPFFNQQNLAKTFQLLVGYFLLFMGFSVQAAEKITLEQALSRVGQEHPTMKAQKSQIQASENGLSAARQQYLPSLSASRTRGQTSDSKQLTTITVQQPLYAGGRISSGVDRSIASVEEARARLGGIWRELMQKTAAAYIGVVKAQERLGIADRSVAIHQDLLASIQRRVEAEISPISDLLLSQSRLAQAQSERLQVLLSEQMNMQSLEELLGADGIGTVAPADPSAITADVKSALRLALEFSPEMRQIRFQQDMAREEVSIERSAALPSVYVRHDQLTGDTGSLPKSQTYLGIEFVPGAGFSAGSKIKAAENRRLSFVSAQEATEKEVRDRTRAFWAERESMRGQLATAASYTEAAQSVADSFARQFAIGRKTWLEVLNARREALVAEMAQSEIFWNGRLATWRLEIELGTLAPEGLYKGQSN